MESDFPEMFSPEWDAERAEFYRALFGDNLDNDGDDEVTRFAIRATPQSDPELLLAGLRSLIGRVHKAHNALGLFRRGGSHLLFKEGQFIAEVLSDAGLMLSHFVELLGPYGRPDDPKLKFEKRRGVGAPVSDRQTIRRGLAIGKFAKELTESGRQKSQKVADGVVAEKYGVSDSYVRKWRLYRESLRQQMLRGGGGFRNPANLGGGFWFLDRPDPALSRRLNSDDE